MELIHDYETPVITWVMATRKVLNREINACADANRAKELRDLNHLVHDILYYGDDRALKMIADCKIMIEAAKVDLS